MCRVLSGVSMKMYMNMCVCSVSCVVWCEHEDVNVYVCRLLSVLSGVNVLGAFGCV